MNIFVCLDEKGGMMFNKRRQSSDCIVRQDILRTIGEQPLYMNAYTAKQFTEECENIVIAENPFGLATEDAFVFVENIHIHDYIANIKKIIVYHWNRAYPADFFLDIDLTSSDWNIVTSEEFEGNSHECIRKEIYRKVNEVDIENG